MSVLDGFPVELSSLPEYQLLQKNVEAATKMYKDNKCDSLITIGGGSSHDCGKGVGFVAFSPLAQGLLTDRYLHGIPDDSRMRHSQFLRESDLTPELLARLRAWDEEARAEGLSLAQYALRWILRRPEVTSVIVGASSVAQLQDSLKALKR